MFILPLLYPLLLYATCVAANPASLVFNRIDVASDVHRHIYVKLHGHSHETVLVNTMVLFRSPLRLRAGTSANASHDAYHNALLIANHVYLQYYRITKESHFPYNNEIPLIARGVDLMMPYAIVEDRDTWARIAKTSYTRTSTGAVLDNVNAYDTAQSESGGGGATTAYQAILSMDRHSSIWDRYNVMSLTHYTLTLRYGTVSTSLDEYDGMASLRCHYDGAGRCIAESSQLVLGDTVYNRSAYRLVIDLHSSSNYLPVHLYYHHQSLGGGDGATIWIDETLPLNAQFRYALNEFDNDVILGVDLLHRFAKVELSVESGELVLWYFDATYVHHARHTTVAIILVVPLLLCLYAYFEFKGCEPGALLRLMVRFSPVTSRWFYFRVRRVFIELLAMGAAFVLCVVSLIFSEFNRTAQSQRAILFGLLSLYHLIILGVVHLVTPDTLRHAVRVYFGRASGATPPSMPADYDIVKEAYAEGEQAKLSREQTVNVIARDTCLPLIVLLAIMTKFNFSTEQCYIYLLVLFIVSLLFLYRFAYYVSLGWLHWFAARRYTPLSYLLFLCGETACLVLYIAWSIHCVYFDYFRAINSIYTEAFMVAVTLTLISFVVLFACRSHYSTITDLIQAHYQA